LLRHRYPNIDVRSDESEAARHDPPDALSLNFGSDLRSWLNKGALASLDATSATEGWPSAFARPILDAASKDGSLYGVPLSVWRENALFYNKEVFANFGLAPPSSFDDAMAAASELDAKGMKAFSMSASGWAASATLFDAILVAKAGPDFHQSYFSGRQTGAATEVRAALVDFATLLDHANADRATLSWLDAAERLCTGQAAMLLMGDYAKTGFGAGCLTPAKIGYLALEPASAPTFVFSANAMAVPKAAALPVEAAKFLEVVGSREAQQEYNQIEETLSARLDFDTTSLDFVLTQEAADLKSASEHFVLSSAEASSDIFYASANTAFERFADPASPDHKNVDAVLATLIDNYPFIHR
jgi:glucose/mannose transport system substrate-binding protein